jgi:hypothetical protein
MQPLPTPGNLVRARGQTRRLLALHAFQDCAAMELDAPDAPRSPLDQRLVLLSPFDRVVSLSGG